MAALPYIQLYVADYIADTMHLTTEEHGAYLLLIFNYWQTGKPIPIKRIASIIKIDNERYSERYESVISSLKDFFNEDAENGVWVHKRLEKDLEKVHGKSTQASEAGKKSAEKRWGKRSNDAGSITPVINPLQRNDNHTDTDTDTDTDKTLKPIVEFATQTQQVEAGKNKPEPKTKTSELAVKIFSHWQAVMNHPKAVLSEKTKKLISARLKEGFTVELIFQAIDGCSKTPHNMGMNERNTRYDSLDLILRDGENVNRFVANNDKQPIVSTQLSLAGNKTLAAGLEWLADDLVDSGSAGGLTEKEVFDAGRED